MDELEIHNAREGGVELSIKASILERIEDGSEASPLEFAGAISLGGGEIGRWFLDIKTVFGAQIGGEVASGVLERASHRSRKGAERGILNIVGILGKHSIKVGEAKVELFGKGDGLVGERAEQRADDNEENKNDSAADEELEHEGGEELLFLGSGGGCARDLIEVIHIIHKNIIS